GLINCGGGSSASTSNPTAPAIVSHPASQTVSVGQAATFTVAATGTSPLSYQWWKNTAAIPGATSQSYTTPPASAVDDGSQFQVVVSNSLGTAISHLATLRVVSNAGGPTITSQPVGQTVQLGQTATFTVAAAGTAPLSYQWEKNGAAVAGATSVNYTTPATTIADNGSQFQVIVSNSAGT